MSKTFAGASVLTLAIAVASPAQATVLLDLIDVRGWEAPYSLNFVATDASTTVTFSGFELPWYTYSTGIKLVQAGQTTNLLGPTWTAAPTNSVWSGRVDKRLQP